MQESMMAGQYNGGLTREQFLFYEIKVVAKLLVEGMSIDDAILKIKEENLFQFPTERMVVNIANVCYRRLQALDSENLIYVLATSSMDVAKQVNLYAMMKQNRIVWDFMITVIGEKYRTQDFSFTKKDMSAFMFQLQEQNEDVATWSDSTIQKIKQVLTKSLVECGYLDNTKSEVLNPVYLYPELEEEIVSSNDIAALPAFNYFA
jgi:hypothetical protein